MISILCYGDSNTFGTNPRGGRWGLHQRWTGILQERLGDDYHIYEEGLGGRTTVFEDIKPDKNGRAMLGCALGSHKPLDLVIIMLGTNDLKHRFSLMPADIASGAAELGKMVESYDFGSGNYPKPKILLVCPIETGADIEFSIYTGFDAMAHKISKQLPYWFEKQAAEHGWHYLNAAEFARPSEIDQLHMDSDSHMSLALAIENKVREIFESK